MANDRKLTDRREFLQLMGLSSAAAMLNSSIAKALTIPANFKTGTIKDVEHIVILMQENNSFDEVFGTLRGVRGFSDPRAVKQKNGNPVFLQPAAPTFGAPATGYVENGVTYGWPANQYGGVTADLVVPPFQINASAATAANAPSATLPTDSLNLVYRPGLDHGWPLGTEARDGGEWDGWVPAKNPLTMAYRERPDVPYHRALADAFTVGDNYYCSFRGPTNVNRCYLWTGCNGNIPGNILPNGTPTAQGTNGHGGGIVLSNGYVNGYPLSWPTYPEMLQAGGVSWRIYQDIVGDSVSTPTVITNDQGSGPIPTNSAGQPVCNGSFVGTYTDNPVLYFQQYAYAPASSPLFQKAATGTALAYNTPALTAPRAAWETWAEGLFAEFQSDVKNGTLPQVSWLVAPYGYSEHPAAPNGYGAWYISQVLDILTSNPEVFSKTVFIINYDENDGSFDHLPAPVPAISTDGSDGATTITADYEQVPAGSEAGFPALPLGFGFRVPFLAISPWSKGGYVNSELSDHTSVVKFIEKRFGVHCPNITPWRRAVSSDLTSFFNFANPNGPTPAAAEHVRVAAGGAAFGWRFQPDSVIGFADHLRHPEAGAGRAPGARAAVRPGGHRRGERLRRHRDPDVHQHRPQGRGVLGAFGQRRGRCACLHRRIGQVAVGHLGHFVGLRPVGLRPERLPAPVQRQQRQLRRGAWRYCDARIRGLRFVRAANRQPDQ